MLTVILNILCWFLFTMSRLLFVNKHFWTTSSFFSWTFSCSAPSLSSTRLSLLCFSRYLIPRYTDLDMFFSINPEDGIIKTTRPLDRETQAWHNISVSATEIGNASALGFQGLLITEQSCFSHSYPRRTGLTFPPPSFRVASEAPSLWFPAQIAF